MISDEEAEYLEWMAKQDAYAFYRVVTRRAKLKRELTCGHWIDASEPYRYQVWRVNNMPRGKIEQRTDCEFCARVDANY